MSSATDARPATRDDPDRVQREPGGREGSGRRSLVGRLLPVVLVGVLLVAMVLDTEFLSAGEVESLTPAEFNAATYAADEFPKIERQFTADAVPLASLVPAVELDPAAAAQEFGGSNISGKFSFPVTVTAEVAEVDENFILLRTPDLPADTEVRVPVGVALNGTPVRDAAGIEFADFQGQTDYQAAANEFKLIMESNVIGPLDVAALRGKTIEVVGAYSTGGPPGSYIVQPVTVTEAS